MARLPGVGGGNDNGVQDEANRTVSGGSATQSLRFSGICDHWNCRETVKAGSDYCSKHQPEPLRTDLDRECSNPLCSETPPPGKHRCRRHQLGVSRISDLPTDGEEDESDEELRERLTRLEAKLDALLLALDVDVEVTTGGDN